MNVLIAQPPNIKAIQKVFGETNLTHAVFTYGEDIYNPSAGYIDEPVGLHEATHSFQQDEAGGPEKWWKRYLSDPTFRLEQELEGYGVQYRRYCELQKDRNMRAIFLFNIARDLSSPQYGNVISLNDARKAIRSFYAD